MLNSNAIPLMFVLRYDLLMLKGFIRYLTDIDNEVKSM